MWVGIYSFIFFLHPCMGDHIWKIYLQKLLKLKKPAKQMYFICDCDLFY